jgi:hypothetical protein
MKKKINPDLLRNPLFNNFNGFNSIIKSKDANSFIFFQDNQIKKELPKFLQMFGIICINCNIIRTHESINVYLDYYTTENLRASKYIFYISSISRLNFEKRIVFSNFLYRSKKIYKFLKNIGQQYLKELTLKKYNIRFYNQKNYKRFKISFFQNLKKYYTKKKEILMKKLKILKKKRIINQPYIQNLKKKNNVVKK